MNSERRDWTIHKCDFSSIHMYKIVLLTAKQDPVDWNEAYNMTLPLTGYQSVGLIQKHRASPVIPYNL